MQYVFKLLIIFIVFTLAACTPGVDNFTNFARMVYHQWEARKAIDRVDYATACAEWNEMVRLSYKMSVWDFAGSPMKDQDSLIEWRNVLALERDQLCQR